jgi:hypothetical protein
VLTLGLLTLALPAAAQEPGTRVSIRMAEASGPLPRPDRVAQSLEAVGGEHQVRVKVQKKDGHY